MLHRRKIASANHVYILILCITEKHLFGKLQKSKRSHNIVLKNNYTFFMLKNPTYRRRNRNFSPFIRIIITVINLAVPIYICEFVFDALNQ
ncbi:hypothetical protein B5G41_09445 [Alistipes onderdonkii]|uniref:Uncharacterized protein n=1 Tax=Alistipes onderdonkii TaxID=328813 RepID=A0A1Y3QSW9_9BACT|nr:hypothetical protein B5G41_09445 [Alistipes onderdonkii]